MNGFLFSIEKKFIFIEKEIGSLQIGSDARGKNGVEVVQCGPLVEQTMEPYSYGGNNPINFTDPTGMSAESYDQDPPVLRNPTETTVSDADKAKVITYATELSEITINANKQNWFSKLIDSFKNSKNPKVDGYVIWGMGSENYGTSDKSGSHKSINASVMGNIGVGGLATQKGSVLGLIQYFSSAFSLYGNDNTDAPNESVKHSYNSYDTRIIPYTDLPFSVVPVQKDTFLLKSSINSTDWNTVRTDDSLKMSNKSRILNKKYKLE